MASEALSRRENEWETSDEEEGADHAMEADSPAATPAADAAASAGGVATPAAATGPTIDPDSEASPSPVPIEVLHKKFDQKRKSNYHSMGALLKQRAKLAAEEEEE